MCLSLSPHLWTVNHFTPILKWTADLNREFSVEESQLTEKQINAQHPIHQGYTNQNYVENSPDTCQNGQRSITQVTAQAGWERG